MNLLITEQIEPIPGLYVVNLNGQSASGLTADEVALLLDSEQYREAKIYRIVRVTPDGSMELSGVSPERFQLESAMIFRGRDESSVENAYDTLIDNAAGHPFPCRLKCHLARQDEQRLSIALIYPAEYEQELGQWLADMKFKFDGPVDAGASAAEQYYRDQLPIIRQQQFWPASQSGRKLDILQTLFKTA